MPVPAPLLALYTPESLLDPANGLLPPSTIAQIKRELSQKKKVIDHVTFECRLSTTGKYIDHVVVYIGIIFEKRTVVVIGEVSISRLWITRIDISPADMGNNKTLFIYVVARRA